MAIYSNENITNMKLSYCKFLRLVQNRENICMKYMAYKITVSTCLYSITSLSGE